MHPFYVIRALGGFLFLVGYGLMIYNIWMTIRSADAVIPAASLKPSLQPAE